MRCFDGCWLASGSFVPEEGGWLPGPEPLELHPGVRRMCAARLPPASREPSIGKELAGVLNDCGDSGMLDLAFDGNSVKLAVHPAGNSNAE